MKKLVKSLTLPMIGATLLTLAFGSSPARANNLFGIDVGSYQGTINWSSVYANGARFAFVSATEGTYSTDSYFKSDMVNGKAAGLQMGAVAFVRPDLDCPSTEANYFWNFAGAYITNDGKSLSPAVDFETFNGVACNKGSYTAWLNAWASNVEAKTTNTMHPIIYVSACTGACDLTSSIAFLPWIANYNGQNLYTGNPWSTCDCCNVWADGCSTANWKFWQVSTTGALGGISGDVDFDAFDGTLANMISQAGVQ